MIIALLQKNNNKCTDDGDSTWGMLYILSSDFNFNKQRILDAIENMINALKEAKKYEKVEEKTYHIGQHFIFDGDEYLLARTTHKEICLFNTRDGNKWSKPTVVNNLDKITEDEMKQHVGSLGYWKDFKLKKEK